MAALQPLWSKAEPHLYILQAFTGFKHNVQMLFHPKRAPETISEDLKSKDFPGGLALADALHMLYYASTSKAFKYPLEPPFSKS